MSPVPLALAVLLAAGPAEEPPPSPPVPVESPEPPAPSEPPTAPPAAEGDAAPRVPAPPTAATPSATPAAPFQPEYAIQAGWSAVTLAGLEATGPDLRLALTVPRAPKLPGAALVSVAAFFGESEAGLLVRSASIEAEWWVDAGKLLRAGAGAGLGLVAYRRATNGDWPAMLVPGLHVGVELAALRWRRGAVVIAGHLAGHLGDEFWGAASIRVGLRFLGAPAAGGMSGSAQRPESGPHE